MFSMETFLKILALLTAVSMTLAFYYYYRVVGYDGYEDWYVQTVLRLLDIHSETLNILLEDMRGQKVLRSALNVPLEVLSDVNQALNDLEAPAKYEEFHKELLMTMEHYKLYINDMKNCIKEKDKTDFSEAYEHLLCGAINLNETLELL